MTRAGGSCRITIVGSKRRVDLTVPAATTVIELLPQLLQLTGEADRPAAGGWLLTRIGGQPLPAESSLDEARIVDGELLFLESMERRPAAPAVEDYSAAVAEVVDASGARWTPFRVRLTLEGLAGAFWLSGVVTVLRADGADAGRWAAIALAAAVALEAAAAVLRWWLRRELAGAAAAIAAVPFWALGATYAGLSAGDGSMLGRLVAAGAGGLVGAGAGWIVAPRLRTPAAALALALAPLTAAGAAVRLPGVTPVQAVSAAAIVVLALVTGLPRAAARVAGLTSPREPLPAVAREDVEPAVSRARRVLAWLLAAAGVDLAAFLALLALAHDAAAGVLGAGIVVAIALRARHHRFVAEALPLVLAAATGAWFLETDLLAGAGAPIQLAALLASGAALAALTWPPLERLSSPHARRWLSRIEVLCNAALVPLAFAATGLFAMAADVGRRIGSP